MRLDVRTLRPEQEGLLAGRSLGLLFKPRERQMIWEEYREPAPKPNRLQEVGGAFLVTTIVLVWAVGAIVTRNGEWMERK
jgi:hypothetical protein